MGLFFFDDFRAHVLRDHDPVTGFMTEEVEPIEVDEVEKGRSVRDDRPARTGARFHQLLLGKKNLAGFFRRIVWRNDHFDLTPWDTGIVGELAQLSS
ncbi:hypothetical protein BH20GEM1_BH20GEM1_00550 [soil metagenome]